MVVWDWIKKIFFYSQSNNCLKTFFFYVNWTWSRGLYKLISAFFMITVMVQFSTANPVAIQKDVIRVEWTKSQYFCGAFLEDLLNEICRGEIISPRYTALSTECCRKKCTSWTLKQRHCNDNSPDGRPYVYVSKRNATMNFSDASTTTPSAWNFQTLKDFISRPYQALLKTIRHPNWMFTDY